MKKQIVNTLREIVKAFFIRFAVPSLLVCAFLPASAQSIPTGEPQLHIKYIGSLDDKPLFQVAFENATGEAYTLSLKDDEGNVLYTEKTKEKTFSKKFKWENIDLDSSKLILSLTSEKTKTPQLFEVNTNFRSYQDVVITKL